MTWDYFRLCLSPSSQCQTPSLLAPWPPIQLTSLFPASSPPYSESHLCCSGFVHPVGTLTPYSAPALFFQSRSWNPSSGQGPGRPPCLGKESRLAGGAVQNSLTNEKLTIWSAATCLRGKKTIREHVTSCHGGSALRIHGPDHGNSRENGFFLVGKWC